MQKLKIFAYVLPAIVLTAFSVANWHDVMIDLWGDRRLAIKLPWLLLVTFALGFLPTWLIDRFKLARLRTRLRTLEGERDAARRPPPPEPSSPF
ncbi:hypothetical protein WJT74_07115 [Sphingomicrobium sp. XHP0239]|uniref:hypothetical protein n=1 Tax=Sphingomicrobium maritimum TaxID=3133972 RepID=UPI0031CC8376